MGMLLRIWNLSEFMFSSGRGAFLCTRETVFPKEKERGDGQTQELL